ncbi:MAG: exonuclease subunit SbcD [Blautia sp.]|nr:exonuclease subunit SbcD [Blautia sp.]
MKVLHTADWHIGQFKGPVEDGVNLRSLDTVKCLEYMVEMAREEKPDLVCISGDVFHQEQIGPVRYSDEMVTATRIIDELSKVSKFVVVMRGTPNHDGAGQFRVLTKMLEHNKKVSVVTTPQVISTPIADIVCIPGFDKQEFRAKFPGLSAEEENLTWTNHISEMVMGLRAQCSQTNIVADMVPAILMAHYTVPGCNMESGQTSFFSNFEPVIPREALQTARFDAVLLGHIHRPQMLEGLENVFYSGAINAMNFNDEGQKRGFWIHEFEKKSLKKGHLYETPYRKFQTIKWDKEDVAEYLRSGKMYLLEKDYASSCMDAIVRLQYSCDTEQKKALNIPVLQKDLYEIGAFYVADIEAESMMNITNRQLLSEESDPLLNLKKWLDEKCFTDSEKIVELADPIIADAMKSSNTVEIHGVFKPVSIKVKNYRTYKEEFFDFDDISFCTINGVNGAGKSSLFMDAISDCLFEETREGDNKSWIRGTEDARSGSIEFVFDIGESRFRVVRTRTKSGKPTLNLSQLNEDGTDWLNLSKERINDTQSEILRVLGMDSMTFRSCALIMQDQYGLFLQARKDERISILGNLLGLGIYGIMEQDARKRLGDAKRTLMQKKDAVKIKDDIIASKGNPQDELEELEKEIESSEKLIGEISTDLKDAQALLVKYEAAKKNCEDLRSRKEQVKNEKASIEESINKLNSIIESCETILEKADVIREKSKEYSAAEDEMKVLSEELIRYESEKKALADCEANLQRYQNIIKNAEFENARIGQELSGLDTDSDDGIAEKIAELEEKREELYAVMDKKNAHDAVVQEVSAKRDEFQKANAAYETQLRLAESDLSTQKQQKAYMEDSGCADIENANCRFLKKAKEDASKIENTEKCISTIKEAMKEAETAFSEFEQKKQEELQNIGYSKEKETSIRERIAELEVYQAKKQRIEESRLKRARLEAEKESNDKTIASCSENASEVKLQAQEITERVNDLSEKVNLYEQVKEKANGLKVYAEQEKSLPVYEERVKNARENMAMQEKQLEKKDEELIVMVADMISASELMESFDSGMESKVSDLEERMETEKKKLQDLQVQKGTLIQKAEDVKSMKEEISELKKDIEACALITTRYDVLKQAFSQDGVPHQIIRNIIPHITDTANNILGQMTGGTMGVDFVMERTVKGKDGDKATLDVLIEEYGKTTLPYASKSGGEKVKASLAVILALSEIKATAAGIQLGMLFIDEPPFLDDDGTQAYVDSLEAIRQRYPDVKVMAITHDDAMKARFNQSVTVIKTEEGSKVIY